MSILASPAASRVIPYPVSSHVNRPILQDPQHGRRGPASEARTLYEELPESVERRVREREARRDRRLAAGAGRPTKRDRRMLDRHPEG